MGEIFVKKIVLLFVLGLFCNMFIKAQEIENRPRIQLSQNIFDWGNIEIPSEGMMQAIVEISNTGTDTLRITEMQTDCGCTVASLQNYYILPSEKESLNVSISVDVGRIEKTISIISNDPQSPIAYILFVGNIIANKTNSEQKVLNKINRRNRYDNQ